MFKVGLIASACLCALGMQTAHAQQNLNPGADALRNIEQNRQALPRAAAKPAHTIPSPVTSGEQGFARLKGINIQSVQFQQELLEFWASSINKPVTGSKMSEFKAFAWELFQSKGYLAYINTSAKDTSEGTELTVTVTRPVVGKVSVVTVAGDTGKEYADEVARRFSEIYKTGSQVDVAGFEAQLNAMAYDLPVDLEVSMRQVDSSVVDVVISLRTAGVAPGTVLGGLVQGNNYGLKQFGRAQALASVRIAGFTPQSELTLTTQMSEGVIYGRAEYEAPIVGTGLHWRAYTAQVKSQANDTKNNSIETGFGLNKLLSTDRYGRWTGIAEISRRDSEAWAATGLQSSFHKDDQVRLRLRAESQKDWVDNFRNEITLYAGLIDLSKNLDDQQTDRDTYQTEGHYQTLEVRGGLSHALDKEKLYTGSIRWVGQLASRNLEGYNNMSLGGILGVRALSTIDGVGDQGLVTQFDLTRQITPSFYAGVLYDAGIYKPHRFNLVPTDNNTSTKLQGAGLQFGGQVDQISWNLSLAKSFGAKPSNWGSHQTQWGSWRSNFVTTWAF